MKSHDDIESRNGPESHDDIDSRNGPNSHNGPDAHNRPESHHTAPRNIRHLQVTAEVAEAGGYLPVDAPFPDATGAEAARSSLPRPREHFYGGRSHWLAGAQGDNVTWRIVPPPAARRGLASPWAGLRADAAIDALGDATTLVMADLLVVPGAGPQVVCVLEGPPGGTARGYRTVWAALERSGGRVQRIDAPAPGEWPPVFPSRASGGWTTLQASGPLPAEVVNLLLDLAPEPGRLRLQLLAGTGAVAWPGSDTEGEPHGVEGDSRGDRGDTSGARPAASGGREWLEGQLRRLGCRVGYVEPGGRR